MVHMQCGKYGNDLEFYLICVNAGVYLSIYFKHSSAKKQFINNRFIMF